MDQSKLYLEQQSIAEQRLPDTEVTTRETAKVSGFTDIIHPTCSYTVSYFNEFAGSDFACGTFFYFLDAYDFYKNLHQRYPQGGIRETLAIWPNYTDRNPWNMVYTYRMQGAVGIVNDIAQEVLRGKYCAESN